MLSACSSQPAPQSVAHPVRPVPAQLTPVAPTLAHAISASTRLGRAGSETELALNFSLRPRQAERLAALIAAGKTVSPAEYQAQFGPDPALVAPAIRYLEAHGFGAAWQ